MKWMHVDCFLRRPCSRLRGRTDRDSGTKSTTYERMQCRPMGSQYLYYNSPYGHCHSPHRTAPHRTSHLWRLFGVFTDRVLSRSLCERSYNVPLDILYRLLGFGIYTIILLMDTVTHLTAPHRTAPHICGAYLGSLQTEF